ncbi:hypothetical protein [Lelliottia sp. WAP21]|uniref:hypothetical protein n=1 Tax=Lelliottia sp. WAP21 TaxID=2877426 RepID=UPI001E481420|nr:hypothetical protein [Lelliottia sp. WAP21]
MLGGISNQGLDATKTMGGWASDNYNSAASYLGGGRERTLSLLRDVADTLHQAVESHTADVMFYALSKAPSPDDTENLLPAKEFNRKLNALLKYVPAKVSAALTRLIESEDEYPPISMCISASVTHGEKSREHSKYLASYEGCTFG